jgi:hypothetical protein
VKRGTWLYVVPFAAILFSLASLLQVTQHGPPARTECAHRWIEIHPVHAASYWRRVLVDGSCR